MFKYVQIYFEQVNVRWGACFVVHKYVIFV